MLLVPSPLFRKGKGIVRFFSCRTNPGLRLKFTDKNRRAGFRVSCGTVRQDATVLLAKFHSGQSWFAGHTQHHGACTSHFMFQIAVEH